MASVNDEEKGGEGWGIYLLVLRICEKDLRGVDLVILYIQNIYMYVIFLMNLYFKFEKFEAKRHSAERTAGYPLSFPSPPPPFFSIKGFPLLL